ncbi:MAG: cobaltochelatase subunit CobN [Alphaproteobacteria bacterium]
MHLLRTETISLDQTAEAVDLALSPAEIVFLSFTDSDLSGLVTAWDKRKSDLPALRAANLKTLQHPFSVDLLIEKTAAKAKFILVRLLGGKDYWSYGVDELARLARQNNIALAIVPGDYQTDERLVEASTLPKEMLTTLWQCFHEGGRDNFNRALDHIAVTLGQERKLSAPEPIPALSLFADACREANETSPRALIIAYRSIMIAEDTAPLIALADELHARGFQVACVCVSSLKDPAAITAMDSYLETSKPDIILNTTAFSAKRDDGTTVLDSCGVPVLQAILATTREEPWAQSSRGLNAADLAMNIVLPELDGRLVTRAISFKTESERSDAAEFTRVIHKPLPDRVAYVANLATQWVRLAKTPRAARKLAMILSDYPHKAGHAGYAVGLDTQASVRAIADDLTAAGFSIGNLPDEKELMHALTEGASSHTILSQTYRALFDALPRTFRDDVIAAWGDVRDVDFQFRIVQSDHLVIALQPLRGTRRDQKSDYHDATRPPCHEYIAFYLWLTRVYEPHALIHCGTHGTLEWLPGKSVALSSVCAPEVLLGALPVIYPFIVNNPGEAAQAKRRLAAITLGHLTPPLVEAGNYGVAADLESLLDEYSTAQTLDPRRASLLADVILTRAFESDLAHDAGLLKGDDRETQLAALDAFLCDVKEMRIADGLHIFGRAGDQHATQLMLDDLQSFANDDAAIRLQNSPDAERDAIIKALDGGFVAPGPAGAPSRGRVDVLPTGRNLYTIDPRGVPTRTAWEIGRKTADELVARHLQDHGEAPRSVVIDLWGSASMRTGGDDLAQAFALLGVRPVWDHASSRVNGFEILPPASFGRPRIDVTLRISGLFRDVFPQQIALFDEVVQAVSQLDESADENPLAAKRRADHVDPLRVFGSAPGIFGLGLGEEINASQTPNRDHLGKAYLEANSHAYRASGEALEAKDAFRTQVQNAEAFVHVQDIAGQDVLDSDAFAEHEGGFAAAAQLLGATPSLYHVDATRSDRAAKVRTVKEEVARVVKARATNPRWIKGQMRHGWRGASEIAETVRNLYAFATLADVTESHHFSALFDATLGDEAVRAFLIENNRPAASSIAEIFRAAEQHGFWVSRRNSSQMILDQILAEAAE